MRIEVGLREMNQQFAEFIHRVEDDGTEIIVTRRGKPIALVTPVGGMPASTSTTTTTTAPTSSHESPGFQHKDDPFKKFD
jgi:prevent-host-death family protein